MFGKLIVIIIIIIVIGAFVGWFLYSGWGPSKVTDLNNELTNLKNEQSKTLAELDDLKSNFKQPQVLNFPELPDLSKPPFSTGSGFYVLLGKPFQVNDYAGSGTIGNCTKYQLYFIGTEGIFIQALTNIGWGQTYISKENTYWKGRKTGTTQDTLYREISLSPAGKYRDENGKETGFSCFDISIVSVVNNTVK